MVPRSPAPGSLELVEAFLRTRNEVTDLSGMRAWSAARGLPGDMTPEVFERALRLREALRSLMLTNNGGLADPEAVDTVNAEIVAGGLRPQVTSDAADLRWPTSGDRVLGAVLAGVVTAMSDGTWQRMKACAADDCRCAFYDHTRNRSGRWCDVAGCGANARMRAYRQRRTTPPDPD